MAAVLHYDKNKMWKIDGCVICGAEHRLPTVAVAEGFAHRFTPLTNYSGGEGGGESKASTSKSEDEIRNYY